MNKPIPDGKLDIYKVDGSVWTYEFGSIRSWRPDAYGLTIVMDRGRTTIPWYQISNFDVTFNSEEYLTLLEEWQNENGGVITEPSSSETPSVPNDREGIA